MPIQLTTPGLAALADKRSIKINTLFITDDLLNPNRIEVEVTPSVKKWGVCSKRSTIAGTSWTIPHMTISVISIDGQFIDGDSRSVWAQLGKHSSECYVVRYKWVYLPNGTREAFDIYNGKIKDVVLRLDGTQWVADLVTTMAQDEYLERTIGKEAGDEAVILWGDSVRGWD